jgi:hypothetical protein
VNDVLPFILAGCAAATAVFSGLNFLRGGSLPAAQAFARMLLEAEPFRKLVHRLANVESRMQACELLLPNMATKTDVAELRGELRAAVAISSRTESPVDRIEGILMEDRS